MDTTDALTGHVKELARARTTEVGLYPVRSDPGDNGPDFRTYMSQDIKALDSLLHERMNVAFLTYNNIGLRSPRLPMTNERASAASAPVRHNRRVDFDAAPSIDFDKQLLIEWAPKIDTAL